MIRPAPWRQRPGAKISARLGIAAVAVVLLVAGCGAQGETKVSTEPDPSFIKPGTLTVCTASPYEPFEFEKNGQFVGFDIDLVNEVAKALGVKTAIKNKGFNDIASGKVLNQNECDVAVAALTITGDRARVVDFSSPYFSAKQAIVVERNSGISSIEDLSGDRIGVQKGSTSELFVTDNAPSDAEVVPFEQADAVSAALDSGDIDAAVYDSTVAPDVIKRYPDMDVARKYNTGEQYGMAVKKNSDVDLLRVVNRVLAELQANNGKGGYEAIFNQWFPKGS